MFFALRFKSASDQDPKRLHVRSQRPRRQLACESLEGRLLLSAGREVSVMSYNLYHGTDVNPVVAAVVSGDLFGQIIPAVTAAWSQIRANDFHARAEAIAEQIEDAEPTLIGLQEADLFTTGPANGPGSPATNVEYDYVQILLDKLAARGLHYEPVVVAVNYAAEFPGVTHRGIVEDIRLTDREVILARTDLRTSELKLSNPQEGHFTTNLSFPTPFGPFELRRSWASVDAKVRGKTFRFVTTHLDADSPVVQVAQASELLAGPANTDLPVILVGDFNSPADGSGTSTYSAIVGAGFHDAWSATHPSDPGFTCCQQADLQNAASTLARRIDVVFTRGNFVADNIELLGETPADRTPNGLWPSDHAGIAAELELLPPGHEGRVQSMVAARNRADELTENVDSVLAWLHHTRAGRRLVAHGVRASA